MRTLTLTDAPALGRLLARGAFLSPCKSLRLPRESALRGAGTGPRPGTATRLVLPGVGIDLARLAAYERVCGFPTGEDAVPLTYPHVLGFPLAMRIMAGRDFPLPLLGLVHTSIEITRRRRLPATGEYEITVYVDGLAPHRRGTEATVVTEVRDGGEDAAGLAWESRSTYLARHRRSEVAHAGGSADARTSGRTEARAGGSEDGPACGSEDGRADARERAREERKALPAVAEWRLAGDVGRRYGAVSGDRNPIHLHPLGARLFGFPRPIAHGMWTVARCLAEHGTPPATLVRAEFRAPVPLPGAVTYAADGQAWGGFELRSGDAPGPGGEQVRSRVHVRGQVYPLVA
ncbi:MaoC/PaaZ C-terminal domain-containing protein [Streptomyces europaeiscabiei]|uniref:MaoC/PaaZ C-terminal domain-containing protein n=1 Tax=Streptomyces europaeiscabiei TaxID=146819 RepID=UPI0029BB3261|nr:MaoC/PaaZ C-terminal domain-containing protein [Streptomyces europaeiscabiei]MDX3861038.1 MaoC/PaaZ C-terminal domain-containing protein [Streptomyces europaeiscabiei]MDX3873584.1 MaoC/PaaZ C-terminal domain-containing protein [Streptomyces europaeiscabiei]